MKSMDIKAAFKACTGLKRKRQEEPNNVNTATKTPKLIKAEEDVEASADHDLCNSSLNTSTHTDSVISSNTLSAIPSNPESQDPADDIQSSDKMDTAKSKLDSSGENKTLKDGNTSDDDDGGGGDEVSSVLSDDGELDSSAMNQSLNISTSSANTCVNDQSDKPVNELEQNIGGQNSKLENLSRCDKTQENEDQPKSRKKRRMTPEEAKLKTELRAEKERKRELRRQEMLEKKEEKRKLKEKKELEKKLALEEKQRKKEEEEQLRKEKKRQEELQKEEKNRLKQLALEAKAEEKRKKEEQKQKALEEKSKFIEEKRKAEEEKKKAEEERIRLEQEKKKKAKEAFVNFFVRSETAVPPAPAQINQSKEVTFRPFQITKGMILATIVPVEALERFSKEDLDRHLRAQDCQDLYISMLKSGEYVSLRSKKNSSKKSLCEDEVIVISDENAPELHLKPKFLQFCENVRPAYWGTWRKKSKNVRARNPFGKDDILDYEVDSDDEWDEGGPGESLTGTEEEESEDDYEVDNEFFVPHGYLSAEEEGEDEDRAPTDPEELKIRLKMKEKEFLHERKKKTTESKSVILGCFFMADGTEDIIAVEKSLLPYSVEFLTQNDIPTAITVASIQNCDGVGSLNRPESSPTNENKSRVTNFKCPVPEEGMPFLIKLLHANTNSRQSVITEFQAFWLDHCKKAEDLDSEKNSKNSRKISKRQLDVKIQNISSWIKSPDPNFKKYCWWVKEEIRKKYDCLDAPVPNQWNYISSKEMTNVVSATPATKTAVENED